MIFNRQCIKVKIEVILTMRIFILKMKKVYHTQLNSYQSGHKANRVHLQLNFSKQNPLAMKLKKRSSIKCNRMTNQKSQIKTTFQGTIILIATRTIIPLQVNPQISSIKRQLHQTKRLSSALKPLIKRKSLEKTQQSCCLNKNEIHQIL